MLLSMVNELESFSLLEDTEVTGITTDRHDRLVQRACSLCECRLLVP